MIPDSINATWFPWAIKETEDIRECPITFSSWSSTMVNIRAQGSSSFDFFKDSSLIYYKVVRK